MPGAFPGHPYVINPAAAAAAQAAAAASQEQYLAQLTAAAGQPILPLHYYAATGFPAPCYPQPGQLMTNGASPAMPPSGQNANARPIQRPPSPAGSQTGSVTPGPGQENPGGPASLPANAAPYQMIPAYYDAKGALVQLPGAGGLPPPVRLLPSPAPHGAHLPHTFSNHVNLGSPISSISGSGNFGGRRDSLDRISNPPFSPSLDFTKTKGGWGGAAGGLTSYGAVGSIASPGLAGLAGSTGSLTPPPSMNVNMSTLHLGRSGVNNHNPVYTCTILLRNTALRSTPHKLHQLRNANLLPGFPDSM